MVCAKATTFLVTTFNFQEKQISALPINSMHISHLKR